MIFQETETIELKRIVVDDLKKEIIAFANCHGGKIYIGVNDDGTVCGLDNLDESALQISNMIRDSIKPDITLFVRYETLCINNKNVLMLDIQEGCEKPYYIAKKGLRPEGVYVRQGFSSVPASSSLIRKMIKETDGDSFEQMRSLEQDLTFLSAKTEFDESNIPFKEKNFGIQNQDGIYTNLGLLLSDQCKHTIKVAVFDGETQNIFQDRNEFTGSLFKQMHEVYSYIDFRNQKHSSFSGLKRIDKRDYPEVAIREALLNLIVHREYSYSASSFIRIYTDRIEFTSIGGLLKGITLEDIQLGISVCRNPKLANIFYRLELIEAYGTGIQKIIDSYSESEFKPQFVTTENAFKIILPNLNYQKKNNKIQEDIVVYDCPENKILEFAKTHTQFTRKDVQDTFNLSQTTCGRILNRMKEEGQISQHGKGKNTFYILKEKK